MPEIILYLTKSDSESIREWINVESEVAWIVKESQIGCNYRWRASDQISEIFDQEYAIWHRDDLPLNIPSGRPEVPDAIVLDPFNGWNQLLETENCTRPWFGAHLPGPFVFRFKEIGHESTSAIGRSGFTWLGNRYASIGKPAPDGAKKWWRRLDRFIHSHSVQIPWPYADKFGKGKAFAFPDAHSKLLSGYHADANP
jgi:hypothetical protein